MKKIFIAVDRTIKDASHLASLLTENIKVYAWTDHELAKEYIEDIDFQNGDVLCLVGMSFLAKDIDIRNRKNITIVESTDVSGILTYLEQ